ncbi:DUF3857 domain-containing protein, partial [bacterium]|nr:DUF3857 domain-containing protein [bacterium]
MRFTTRGRVPFSTAAALVLLSLILVTPALADTEPAGLPPGDSPPPTAFSRLDDAGGTDDFPDADYIIVFDETVNRVKPTGVTYGDSYMLYKMLTPEGCRDRSVLRWGYEPWSSHVEIREVSVLRGDERIIVDVSAVHDLPAPQSAIYWNSRIKTLQLPRLEVGDGVEVLLFRKGYSYALLDATGAAAQGSGAQGGGGSTSDAAPPEGDDGVGQVAMGEVPDDAKYVPPMAGEYFDIVLFQGSVPIVERRYELVMPPEKRLHSQVYNGPLYAATSYTEDATTYTWWATDVPALSSEPRQPAASDRVAKVVVATVESWEAKSRWFFDANRNQFDVTPEIQEKVDEILQAAGVAGGTEAQKAEVLVHWVAQNIRYSGQTMGEGEGFTLHSGAMIFEQRSGVCKDIAGMLVTMMRAADMDSYAAMTMAGSRIEKVPADQFNHCVCALRTDDGSFEMYDPTWVPYQNDIWSKSETEQQYLIGSPAGEPLASIPYSPPEESEVRIRHDARILEDGTLEGTFRLVGSCAMDSRLRGMVSMSRYTDIENDIAYYWSELGAAVEILGLSHVRVDDFSEDAWIEVEYRVAGYALAFENGLEFESPLMVLATENGWLCRSCVYDWGDERASDVFLWFTQLIDAEETIRLPGGYSVADPESSDEIDETYGYFRG